MPCQNMEIACDPGMLQQAGENKFTLCNKFYSADRFCLHIYLMCSLEFQLLCKELPDRF